MTSPLVHAEPSYERRYVTPQEVVELTSANQ